MNDKRHETVYSINMLIFKIERLLIHKNPENFSTKQINKSVLFKKTKKVLKGNKNIHVLL